MSRKSLQSNKPNYFFSDVMEVYQSDTEVETDVVKGFQPTSTNGSKTMLFEQTLSLGDEQSADISSVIQLIDNFFQRSQSNLNNAAAETVLSKEELLGLFSLMLSGSFADKEKSDFLLQEKGSNPKQLDGSDINAAAVLDGLVNLLSQDNTLSLQIINGGEKIELSIAKNESGDDSLDQFKAFGSEGFNSFDSQMKFIVTANTSEQLPFADLQDNGKISLFILNGTNNLINGDNPLQQTELNSGENSTLKLKDIVSAESLLEGQTNNSTKNQLINSVLNTNPELNSAGQSNAGIFKAAPLLSLLKNTVTINGNKTEQAVKKADVLQAVLKAVNGTLSNREAEVLKNYITQSQLINGEESKTTIQFTVSDSEQQRSLEKLLSAVTPKLPDSVKEAYSFTIKNTGSTLFTDRARVENLLTKMFSLSENDIEVKTLENDGKKEITLVPKTADAEKLIKNQMSSLQSRLPKEIADTLKIDSKAVKTDETKDFIKQLTAQLTKKGDKDVTFSIDSPITDAKEKATFTVKTVGEGSESKTVIETKSPEMKELVEKYLPQIKEQLPKDANSKIEVKTNQPTISADNTGTAKELLTVKPDELGKVIGEKLSQQETKTFTVKVDAPAVNSKEELTLTVKTVGEGSESKTVIETKSPEMKELVEKYLPQIKEQLPKDANSKIEVKTAQPTITADNTSNTKELLTVKPDELGKVIAEKLSQQETKTFTVKLDTPAANLKEDMTLTVKTVGEGNESKTVIETKSPEMKELVEKYLPQIKEQLPKDANSKIEVKTNQPTITADNTSNTKELLTVKPGELGKVIAEKLSQQDTKTFTLKIDTPAANTKDDMTITVKTVGEGNESKTVIETKSPEMKELVEKYLPQIKEQLPKELNSKVEVQNLKSETAQSISTGKHVPEMKTFVPNETGQKTNTTETSAAGLKNNNTETVNDNRQVRTILPEKLSDIVTENLAKNTDKEFTVKLDTSTLAKKLPDEDSFVRVKLNETNGGKQIEIEVASKEASNLVRKNLISLREKLSSEAAGFEDSEVKITITKEQTKTAGQHTELANDKGKPVTPTKHFDQDNTVKESKQDNRQKPEPVVEQRIPMVDDSDVKSSGHKNGDTENNKQNYRQDDYAEKPAAASTTSESSSSKTSTKYSSEHSVPRTDANTKNQPDTNQSFGDMFNKQTDPTIVKGGKMHNAPEKVIQQSDVIREVSRFIQQADSKSITLRIQPEHLGKIKIMLDVMDNIIKASIEVENEAVKKTLEQNLPQLFQNVNQNGVQLSSVNITYQGEQQKEERQYGSRKKSQQNRQESFEVEEDTNVSEKRYGYNTYEYLI